ncbi:MAG TPA: sialate O-acetylesterase [Luteolibacter sp.]
MKTHSICSVALITVFASLPALARPPHPADPFGNGMVLQRGKKVPVWGQADADAQVTVAFAGQTKTGKADANGAWNVELDPMVASAQNRVMTVSSGAEKTEFKDVLVGEVWICSGQSNMEFAVYKDPVLAKEAATADDSELRLRTMYQVPAAKPRLNILGTPWLPCNANNLKVGTPQNKGNFSAVAYVFGRQLRKELKVPVGLVEAAWGGTRIEPWTPLDATPVIPSPKGSPVDKGAPHQQPAALYHGMILPWTGYAIRGAIWYQGESNCMQQDGMLYADRMQAMVSGWRAAWKQGDFPFYFVQIAPFPYGPGLLPVFWQAQTKAAREIPAAGMAVTQDVGNWKDIHPSNKIPVGERLARLALSRTYRVKFRDDCGPVFKSAKAAGDKVRITFDHAASGLAARDSKPLTGFEIAGADGKFVPAHATVLGGAVVVSDPQVKQPVQVRFGWIAGQDTNLMNGEKLPAVAFDAMVN